MRSWMSALAVVLLTSGCTTHQLVRSTNSTQETMVELRYRHILDDLAMEVKNPATLPNPCAVSSGVVQISDNGNASGNVTWNPFGVPHIAQYFLGLGASRTVSEQWALTPIHNPTKLMLMRSAYQLLLDSDLVHHDNGAAKLQDFLGPEEFAVAIPKGWFHVGKRKDVPKCARFCGHYCDLYVWVEDDGLEGLSRFSLTLLEIALIEPYTQTAQVTRIYEGGPASGKLKSTEVRTLEPVPVKDETRRPGATGEFHGPTTGLQFVPR